jgi:MFS family permease
MTSALVARLAPPLLRGRYQGQTATAFAASGVLGPLLGAAVLDRWGALLWAGCLGVGAASAATMLALGPALRRRLADAPAT